MGADSDERPVTAARPSPPRRSGMGPAATDVDAYLRNGFLVVPGMLGDDELDALRRESVAFCRGARGAVEGLGDVGPDVPDEEVLRRALCIHFPHKSSPLMRELLALPAVVEVLMAIIGPDIKAMQSMLFLKAEGKPGQAWHQDEFFIPTRDRSLTAVWLALDDATTENGCLWALPGSHLAGVIYPERAVDDERFDCSTEAFHFPYSDDEAVPVEVPAGGAVIFNGYLLHRSLPNTAKGSLRRAVANHYMSAQSLLPWRAPIEGEHMAMVDDRDIVMVAGRDPYAYKPLEDNHHAYVRPDRLGGCER